ncbi:MAG: cytochrome c biogenesis protein CcsA [Pirellulales bacterium]
MTETFRNPARLLAVALLAVALAANFVLAPTERTMGSTQRIVYLHVPMAWLALAGFLVVAGAGAMYLLRRDLAWDDWAPAAAELGWLCCGLTLATGSLWAREAWGTWWTWDPRLTAAFVLWCIYSGYLVLRSSVESPHQRARVAAVLAVLGVLDLPLVVMATRWFRGIHPAAPTMEPSMRLALLISAAGFTAFFAMLLVHRRRQLGAERLLASCEDHIEAERPADGDLHLSVNNP